MSGFIRPEQSFLTIDLTVTSYGIVNYDESELNFELIGNYGREDEYSSFGYYSDGKAYFELSEEEGREGYFLRVTYGSGSSDIFYDYGGINLNSRTETAPNSFYVLDYGLSYSSDKLQASIEFKVSNTEFINQNVTYSYTIGETGFAGSGTLRSVGGCPGGFGTISTCGGAVSDEVYIDDTTWTINNDREIPLDSSFNIEFCNQDNICSGELTFPIKLKAGSGGGPAPGPLTPADGLDI